MAKRARWTGKIRQRAYHSAFARRVSLPVSRLIRVEEIAGGPLIVSAVIALIWANVHFGLDYRSVWAAELTLQLANFSITESVKEWVNDLLMPLFFFWVGLEIKRELVWGELSAWKRAAFPVLTALGAMLVPAGIYLAINLLISGNGSAWRGWGVPVATDIAFALAVLSLLGPRVPTQLKVFLLAYAAADDVGGIIVIASFYSHGLSWSALGIAAGVLALIVVVYWLRVYSMWVYWILGAVFVLAMLKSGVHTTVAGAILGLLAPAHAAFTREQFAPWSSDLIQKFQQSHDETRQAGNGEGTSNEQEQVHKRQQAILGQLEELVSGTESPVERLSRQVSPWASYVILPLFALANAGVRIGGDEMASAISSPIALGVLIALVVGKPLGIIGTAWLATALGIAQRPNQVLWIHIIGTGLLGGIGFTISLFIAELAFSSGDGLDESKIGILAASVMAGLAGYLFLLLTTRRESQSRGKIADDST